MPNKNTIAPKDFAQETSSAKMRTAKAIIWNSGEELKQVSVNTLVNNNVTKDAVPTEGSANLVASGGVWNALDSLGERVDTGFQRMDEQKEEKAYSQTFADNTFLILADNTIYTASEPISFLSLDAQASGTSVVSFDTASSGTITITLQTGIKFPSQPVFGNNEHWEIAIRNGYAVYAKYDLV